MTDDLGRDSDRRSPARAILWAWLLCGILDIASAIVIAILNNGSPIRMLQGIAGAVLGPQTFELGPDPPRWLSASRCTSSSRSPPR